MRYSSTFFSFLLYKTFSFVFITLLFDYLHSVFHILCHQYKIYALSYFTLKNTIFFLKPTPSSHKSTPDRTKLQKDLFPYFITDVIHSLGSCYVHFTFLLQNKILREVTTSTSCSEFVSKVGKFY